MSGTPCFHRFNPLNDFLFKKTFGERGGEELLLALLNAVLRLPKHKCLKSLVILEDKTLTADYLEGKESILDVRSTTEDNTTVNIEVQLRNLRNMDARSLFYWSREFSKGIEAGADYRELPKVITINIINYNFIELDTFHTCFQLRENTHPDYILTDLLEIHFIEMTKFRKYAKNNRDNEAFKTNDLHRWLTFFDIHAKKDEIDEVIKMDETIREANEKMGRLLTDKETLRRYQLREMALSDYTTGMNRSREEGKLEGKLEEKLEMVKAMLQQHADDDFIKAVAKISSEHLDEIKKELKV